MGNDKPVGIGFIGAGEVSQLHAKAIHAIPEAQLVGLWSIEPEQAAARSAEYACRRFASAEELVNDPTIILADEPTANLDSKTAENLLDLMARLNHEEHMTFIFSTHDQRVIDRAKRVVTLEDGKIVSDVTV